MNKTKIIMLLLVITGTCLIIPIMIKSAWLCDDAYITFRTVDNFTHGLGLTWNTDERVQAYTHPLWMFLVSSVYLFTNEIYFTSIILSLIVSLGAIVLFAWKIPDTPGGVIAGFSILCLSKAFIDYTTSGLENPLTFFLMVLFFIVYLKHESLKEHLFLLSFLAALCAVNRLDTILLYVPPLFYAYIRSKKWFTGTLAVFTGFFPLYLWTGFSLIYYGFPFPNTAYAKLNTGIEPLLYIEQGFRYLRNMFTQDPVGFLVILLGLIACTIHRKKRIFFASLGILLYITYVVKIGGDFMGGRFLTAPFFCSVLILCSAPAEHARQVWAPVTIIILFLGFQMPRSPLYTDESYSYKKQDANGVADERGFYYSATGLLTAREGKPMPAHRWVQMGKNLNNNERSVWQYAAVGFVGFFAGPKVHIVDIFALSEPLLARFHTKNKDKCKIGHFSRVIPEGYLSTLWSKRNHLQNKHLAKYYDKLALLIRGDIFSMERIKEIWNMNMGKYDYLLSHYRHEMIKIPAALITPSGDNEKYRDQTNTLAFTSFGVEIDLGKRCTSSYCNIDLNGNDSYEVEFRTIFCTHGRRRIGKKSEEPGGLFLHTIEVPEKARKKGYTHIRIFPLYGDADYRIGDLTLSDF